MSISDTGEPASQASRNRSDGGLIDFMRPVALIVVVAGAAVSIGLMLRAGHPPLFLRVLFAGWVLSPFIGLVVAHITSKRRSVRARTALYGVMLIVTLGSLAFYADIVPIPPETRPAAVFLMVPLGSWLLLMLAVAIAARSSRGMSRRGTGG